MTLTTSRSRLSRAAALRYGHLPRVKQGKAAGIPAVRRQHVPDPRGRSVIIPQTGLTVTLTGSLMRTTSLPSRRRPRHPHRATAAALTYF